ncbi:MAG: hypothetical protein ABIP39_04145 [Polyangiaceae bacterium]
MRSAFFAHPKHSVLALLASLTPVIFVACGTDDVGIGVIDAGDGDAATADENPANDDAGMREDTSTADARLDGAPADAPSDVITCTSNTTGCAGDNLVVCGDAGAPLSVTSCALGCVTGTTPACSRLSPSNLPATTCDTAGAAALTVGADTSISTDSGCDATLSQGGGAPQLCIKKYSTVSISAGVKLTVTGARALVLVATDDMSIAGTIDFGGKGAAAGPGASTSDGTGGTSAQSADGAGGGGHATLGAAGSSNIAAGAGGTAGTMFGVASLVPLIGGAGGGANGAGGGGPQAAGGGGGGAAQLVSCKSFTLASTGVLQGGGGGGAGGPGSLLAAVQAGGGGGAGSGGAILIEAPAVTIAGTIAANGGGGGGGGLRGNLGTAGAAGQPGQDGKASTVAATGGTSNAESGIGGAGGVGATAPVVGAAPTVSTGSAGGGGGAVGIVRVNVRSGHAPTITGTITPASTTGAAGVH